MKKIDLAIAGTMGILLSGLLIISGCGGTASATGVTTKTTITYSINGTAISDSVITYNATAGQTVTVTANITGPDKDTVNTSWGYSMSGGYSGSLPTTTATSISCKSNTSGKVVITGAPSTTKRVNGEDLIVGSVQINVIYQ